MRLALSHAAEGAPGPRRSLQLSCCRRVAAGLEDCSIRDLPQGVGSEHAPRVTVLRQDWSPRCPLPGSPPCTHRAPTGL